MTGTPEQFERAVISARLVMFSMGIAIIAASTRFAEIKVAIGADDQTFGTVVAISALGGLTSTTFSARLADRFGTKRLIEVAGVVMMVAAGSYGFARNIYEFALAAIFGGLGYSAMNIAINAQGVEIERGLGRSVMPTLHGIWSMGALASALGGNFAAGHLSVQSHMAANTVAALGLLAFAARGLLPASVKSSHDTQTSVGPMPAGSWRALFIITIAFAMGMIGDSGAFDWSAIHLHEDLGVAIGPNSIGVTVFLVSQITIRMLGGRLGDRYGMARAVRTAAAFGATGYGLALVWSRALVPNSDAALVVMLIGIFALGIGTGLIPSAFMTAAGSIPGVGTARGIAKTLLLLNITMLLLKPAIASIAQSWGLTNALLVTAASLFTLIWSGRVLLPRVPTTST